MTARPYTNGWLRALAGAAMLLLAACGDAGPKVGAPILLFSGAGTSRDDVAAVEAILRDSGLRYATANSRELDAMSEAQLRAYRLLIVPGGNFEEIGNGLKPETTAHVRSAVSGGLNYFGICAGAFFAGASPYNGLNLTGGVRFNFYALEASGIRKAAVSITSAGAPAIDQYWEDGPELSGWGEVVSRYPDGSPATTQGAVGQGWMVLTGIHPEAPESWRRGLTFATSARDDHAYAAMLVQAALNRSPLPHGS